jgi:hypothetical protein
MNIGGYHRIKETQTFVCGCLELEIRLRLGIPVRVEWTEEGSTSTELRLECCD